jgi:hypothetical protein
VRDLGELGIIGSAGSIANATHQETGMRDRAIPRIPRYARERHTTVLRSWRNYRGVPFARIIGRRADYIYKARRAIT